MKSAAKPEIPARYYARMGEMLQRAGFDLVGVLKAAGLRVDQLTQPDAMLRLDQVERLVAEVSRIGRGGDLVIDLGRSLKLSSHSIVGYGMLSSPNVDYALRLAARFFRLIMPIFSMRYRRDAQKIEIIFQPTLAISHACLVFHLEALAVATHWEVRELVQGRLPQYDIYFSIAEPPHVARYAELVEARCHFAVDMNPGLRMVMPASVADRPLALADAASLQMAEARCSTLVRSVVAGGKVGDWVGMMLREASEGMPSLAELAHTLNVSPRTLDRYLRHEGIGFRELAKRVRHQKACALLDEQQHSVTQIAYQLGYADAANFTRAFRREARISPSEYRQRRRAPTRSKRRTPS